ncbi:MAG: histidine--tRNA ligase [Candidatus Bathyarchaeota archaeon]|nr:histidine--tRNA ligase [Candidatus Bathyarchaeota archaeon]MDH5596130.1 histidine--tRNA ligase [Candidatus Bathyarchaeota archaeon]
MSTFRTVRGMRDFLPKEAERMRYTEQVTRDLAQLYGYGEVITPVVESYDLLAAKSGEEIRKRMYAFKDLGGRRVALRPEFTASIARLMATKMRNEPKPMRLFCVGSLYRYDEPQYGRFREFWQANYELIGSSKPEADAEILMLTYDLMEKLGLRNYWLKIGHVGIIRGILAQENVKKEQQNVIMQLLDKKQWDEALTATREFGVSQKCVTTLKEILETRGKDVSRILKKIEENVRDYESAVAAVENLREITEFAKESDAKFEMLIEAGFARGLEYYTGMIFEPYVPDMDIALSGGGRYDKLIELFGGEPTPAVGVAQGIDRLALAVKKQKGSPKISERKRIVIIPIGEKPRARVLELSLVLRRVGIPVEVEVMGRTVSKALQDANRKGVTHAVIVGAEELKEDKVVLREMKKREQRTVKIRNLSQEILKT